MVNEVNKLSENQKKLLFDKEMLPHLSALYNFAYRLSLNEDDSNDLVQETFLKAFRFIESFRPGTNAKAWLFRILKNSFINEYRKNAKKPTEVDYNEVESYYNSDEVNEEITSDLRVEAISGMMGDEVANALNNLDIEFRTVIILCDLEGFKYDEMSKILDIPIGTVRSRLHRARQLLREELFEYSKKMGFTKRRS